MHASEFWVVYDYGMGGAWAVAQAASADEITRVLPELKVINERPAWMTPETEAAIRQSSSFVVGDPSTYPEWVRTLFDER